MINTTDKATLGKWTSDDSVFDKAEKAILVICKDDCSNCRKIEPLLESTQFTDAFKDTYLIYVGRNGKEYVHPHWMSRLSGCKGSTPFFKFRRNGKAAISPIDHHYEMRNIDGLIKICKDALNGIKPDPKTDVPPTVVVGDKPVQAIDDSNNSSSNLADFLKTLQLPEPPKVNKLNLAKIVINILKRIFK